MKTRSLFTLAGAAAAVLLLSSGCSTDPAAVETVEAPRAVELIEAGDHTVIDVRTPAEFAAGHVEGAVNLDVTAATFEQQVEKLDQDEEYLVYCQSGNRSASAADAMADLGFGDVVDAGGILSLEAGGARIVQGG
jgi:rhodanese-related sulfurtransferase